MEADKLAQIINEYFGHPNFPKGFVKAQVDEDGVLKLWIGSRGIHIDKDGEFKASDTRVQEYQIEQMLWKERKALMRKHKL